MTIQTMASSIVSKVHLFYYYYIYMHYYVTRIWSYKVSSITVACLSLGGYEQEFITDQP